ncbi:acyl-CoA dehydrogenase family protein [Bacillus benzoevorans]|uniref:Alkylation response protein AidB-like acyl-CoA dehydrogenase n=1 Tax=Bacillus benzoevorans TaxID=1456 RepID=A0A7X0HWG5_9BACI|nr:acyl-CoA dehydrogenase family protein [Bacillus benzoevorans]MBB6446871.1 alkylation response protein AidB-like acyl-CoA dehydrogenase [Bacillus benzoevorans]
MISSYEYYHITEEQELMVESVREWCERNFTEEDVKEWCKNHRVPDWIYKSWTEAGFGLLGLPEEAGGITSDSMTQVLVLEELQRCAGVQMPFLISMQCMNDLTHFGTKEQTEEIVQKYRTTGKANIVLALSEPNAGSDSQGMSTVVKQVGDKFILNGNKCWISNGTDAEYCIIVAKDDDPSRTNKNHSLWLIPMSLPGIDIVPAEKIGTDLIPFCDYYFTDVELKEEYRLGEKGKGFYYLMKNFESERLNVCANNLGLAQAAMDDAAAYVSQRTTFGKEIKNYQLIQEKLVRMEIKLQNLRSLLYKTAWENDNRMDVKLSTALLKYYSNEATTEITDDALQIFGGIGYTKDTRVGRLWVDARGMAIGGGTSEIMVHIAGRILPKLYQK